MLTSYSLAESHLKCQIHQMEHGSDHRAIETELDMDLTEPAPPVRYLFKNAPWNKIKQAVEVDLRHEPIVEGTQNKVNQLLRIVSDNVFRLTPIAKPSPYAKRWWTDDLTRLRKVYTRLRNQASTERRAGNQQPNLELRAKKAAKEYHSSLRIQKKLHWTTFLGDHKNIWEASKYLRSDLNTSFAKIPAIQKTDGATTTTPVEQASLFLENLFPSLPHIKPDVSEKASENPLPFCNLTMQEVEIAVLEANQWKAPGNSGLPSVVWSKLWPVISSHVLSLFQTSLDEGINGRKQKLYRFARQESQ